MGLRKAYYTTTLVPALNKPDGAGGWGYRGQSWSICCAIWTLLKMVIVIENGISDGFIYILKKKKVYITQYILTQALCQKKKKKDKSTCI